MSEIVIAIASKIGEYLVEPTIGHVHYLLHFKSNVKDLKTQQEELRLKQERVQHDVLKAEWNAEHVEGDVQKWLTDVRTVMEDVQKLEEEAQLNKTCFNGCCPNWSRRYRLSKEATKKKATIVKLQENRRFDRVSYQATLPGIQIFSSKDFMPSKTSAFVQIMEALTDEKCDIIGLYGIGGVGKTTLAKEVGKKAKEKGLVDVVVMAVVSQNPDVRKIQDQIADFLVLKFDGAGELERVSRLCSRLKEEKKILIILDDVWDRCDLSTMEIPYSDDQKGCNILLTTRRLHVCNSMKSKKNMPLDALSKMEAWALFKKSSDLDDNSPTFNDVAMEVAAECKGLPLAIVTVGSALKGKTLDEYKLASKQLKRSRLVDIENVDRDVYASLRLSYNYLNSEETKSCFLLCSLFPEDYEINMEDLVGYGMGLHFFQDITSIEEARSQLRAIINNLKDSSLLIASSKQQFVKLHDVVRDVALWIASKGDNVFMVRARVGLEKWPEEERFEQQSH